MPIKLVPPRKGKTPFWYARGQHLGIGMDRSTGTAGKRLAGKIVTAWCGYIERGEVRTADELPAPGLALAGAPANKPTEAADKGPLTFVKATAAYLKAGGSTQYLGRILSVQGEHAIAELPVEEIGQEQLDTLAVALYPRATSATRNRNFYTPVSAVLKHVGIERKIRRPKGWRGSKATSWLEPDQAFALLKAAYNIDPEFGLLCLFLLYTGVRLDEALSRPLRDLRLDRAYCYLPNSKNGEPRGCHLPPIVVEAFRAQPPRKSGPVVRGSKGRFLSGGRPVLDAGVPFLDRDRDAKLFRFHDGGALRGMLKAAMKSVGLSFPRRQGAFHIFCHTYGSWMHQFAKLDTYGLTRTGRWADADSADRYVHTQASEEARRADMLPTPGSGQAVEFKAVVG